MKDAVRLYRESAAENRTDKFLEIMQKVKTGPLVASAMLERIVPEYHVLENSKQLKAHPLFPLQVQGHYHQICSHAFSGRLEHEGLLGQPAAAAVASLGNPNLKWLGNVPIEGLVELRMGNENAEFRKKLFSFSEQLNSASLADIDRVSAEVAHGITGMLAEHQRDAEKISEKYGKRHALTAAGGILTAGALFVPALAPLLGGSAIAAGIGVGSKYTKDKVDERTAHSQLSRSLLGMLSVAKKEGGEN